MKIKIALIAVFLLLLSVAGPFIIYYLSIEKKSLFLVLPNELGSPRLNINNIEDFCETDFLLTYEIPASERVSLPQGDYPVTLIGTNSSYPSIMGLSMLEGAFFTKQAWTGKQRHAVLNEEAAFAIFGSSQVVNNRFRIRNDTWLVTGVIQNGDDDKAKIYVPSSVRGGEANALALVTSSRLDGTYVKNSLKSLGIQGSSFDFIDFSARTRLFFERTLTIMLIAVIFLLLTLLRPLIIALIRAITDFKKDLEQLYLIEIIKNRKKAVARFIFIGLRLVLFPILAVFLLIKLVSMWLPWQDIPSLSGLNKDLFYPHISWLTGLETISLCLFIVSLVAWGCFYIWLNFIIKKA
ncbi:MAG: ABC transporter permease [Treponema sp.]|nr:ABC transporter permease [Treponema sp.]